MTPTITWTRAEKVERLLLIRSVPWPHRLRYLRAWVRIRELYREMRRQEVNVKRELPLWEERG